MKTQKQKLLLTGIIIFTVAVLIGTAWSRLTPSPLIIQGEVEATQIDVAAKISGRVETVHVSKGSTVTKGQVLVTIDSPEIRAKLQQATAALEAATAQKNKAYNGTRKENIKSANSIWEKAQASRVLAEKTYKRIDHL